MYAAITYGDKENKAQIEWLLIYQFSSLFFWLTITMEYSQNIIAAVGGCGYTSATSPSSSVSPATNPSDIDNQLAGAGYQVRTSDLRQVAQRLESLENAMVNAPFDLSTSDGLVHYNPSDLFSWVESLLSEVELNNPTHLPGSAYPYPYPSAESSSNYASATWTDPIAYEGCSPLTAVAPDVEEDSGIRIVHLLLTCAESVQRGDLPLAAALLEDMKLLIKLVNTTCGIGKVAGYFMDALSRRIYHPPPAAAEGFEHQILYHHFYEACPYLKFAHFTANQAILEAFHGHDRVHVIDFNVMHGLQWPPLIQALALRPGGPPCLTLTGIGPQSPDGRDSLQEVGLKLAQLARSVNVQFTFHGVATTSLDDVNPWTLDVNQDEAVAVNSIMMLHRLLRSGSGLDGPGAIDSVLRWIKALNPKIVTVVEQEANHNRAGYLDRFTEALHYYSTMFDSLEACQIQPEKALAEIYIQREIHNILCCEGPARVARHEPLTWWRTLLDRSGFKPLHLGSNAFKQASMLLTLFSAAGYCVEEIDGCLTLGWHSRPLMAASAWQAGTIDGPS